MKPIFIALCGAAVVLLIALSANALFAMLHGHPNPYGSWLQALLTRHYGMVVVLVFGVLLVLGLSLFGARDSDTSDPF
jgi:hypothetical protein